MPTMFAIGPCEERLARRRDDEVSGSAVAIEVLATDGDSTQH